MGDPGDPDHPAMTTSSSVERGRERFWRPAGPDAECPRCGGTGYVRRRVPVGHELFGRATPCECAERLAAQRLAAQLQRLSNLGPLTELRLPTEEIEQSDDLAAACEFADETAVERWLVVVGKPNSGRTQLAAELANRRLERGRSALYFVAADLLDRLRAAYRQDAELAYPVLFEHAREAEFLVIDDVDMANPTEWAREKLFQLLNHRRNAGLRTVLIAGEHMNNGLDLARWLSVGPGALRIALGAGRAVRYRQVGELRRELLARYTFDNFRVHSGDGPPPDSLNLKLVKCIVEDWAAEPRGSLTLIGGTGTGKTHLAAAAANAALERGESVWFAVVPDLLDMLRRTYQADAEQSYDELSASLRDAGLLVLDDFGAHSPTAWAEEKLYQLCAARYVAERPTMFTTNLQPDNLDARIASRLSDKETGKLLEIKAPDYRTGLRPQPTGDSPRGRRRNGGRA